MYTGILSVSCLSRILKGEEGLLSWGTPEIRKKVVMISGQFMETGASLTQTILVIDMHPQTLAVEP